MSKRVIRKNVNMVGSQEDEEESVDVEERGMEAAIQDFAEGKNLIKLYRHPDELTGGRPRLLCSLAREDFNDVYVQNRFGGGKYFGRWRKKDGTYTRFNFDVDGEPKVQTRAVEDAQRQESEQEGSPYGFLKKPQDQDERDEPDRGLGTADILRIMAETRRESREEMRMLLELMRPVNQPPDATEKVFSLVEKIVPMIAQGGDGSNSNPWLFALSQLKEPLMKMVDTIHLAVTQPKTAPGVAPSAATQPDGRRLTQPPPAPEPTPSPAPDPEPKSEDDMLVESFRPYLGLLMKAASELKDPGLYCDLILDQIPVFAYDRLRVWLEKDGCLDQLAKLEPALYAQRGWWEELRKLLLEELTDGPPVGEHDRGPRNLQPVPHRDPSGAGPADSA